MSSNNSFKQKANVSARKNTLRRYLEKVRQGEIIEHATFGGIVAQLGCFVLIRRGAPNGFHEIFNGPLPENLSDKVHDALLDE